MRHPGRAEEDQKSTKKYPPTHPGAVTKVSGGWCVWLARELPESEKNLEVRWSTRMWLHRRGARCPWVPEHNTEVGRVT